MKKMEEMRAGDRNEDSQLYSVGEVCGLVGITRKTLFYYDRIGLLTPTRREGVQNYKLYDSGKIARLKRIMEYRDAGLKIAEIRELMDDQDTDPVKVLEEALARIQTEISDADEQIGKLRVLIAKERDSQR